MQFAKIALRNLTRQKRRSVTLSLAIAVGVLIVTLLNAFAAGSVRIIKENIAELFGGHISINREEVFVDKERSNEERMIRFIDDDAKVAAAMKALGISEDRLNRNVGVTRSQVIFNGSKSFIFWLGGLDWDKDRSYIKYLNLSPDQVAAMKADPRGILMNRKSAKKLGVAVGDSLLINLRTVYGQSNQGDFIVRVITDDEGDTNSYAMFTSYSFLRPLLDLRGDKSYSTLSIRLDNIEQADVIAEKLRESLKAAGLTLKPKAAETPDITSSVGSDPEKSEKFSGVRWEVTTVSDFPFVAFLTQVSVVINIILVVVFLILMAIIMVGIGNTFRMILFERTVEIGTLRALGMQQSDVRKSMLYEAVFLSLVGGIAGLILSGIGMLLLGLMSFDTSSQFALFLSNGHLSFLLSPGSIIFVLVVISLTTLLAALVPAGKAAKLSPAAALRATN